MRLPPNGTLLANVLLVAAGAAIGATGYWTADRLVPAHFGAPPAQQAASPAWKSSDDTRFPRDDRNAARPALPPIQEEKPADAAQRLRLAAAEIDPRVRSEMLRRAGAEGARRDVAEALKQGHALDRAQDRLDYFRGLFGVWSESDPEAALDYAQRAFGAGLLQSELISLAVHKWGTVSPQDARLWAEQNLTGPPRAQALTDLMVGWTRRSPELAASWIQNSDLASASMLSAVGVTWAEQDPQAAALWAAALPTRSGRRTASLSVANEWARQNPQAAAEFFEDDTQGDYGPDLATVLADVWGASDPAAAAQWVSELPSGQVRDQAAGTLATVWATVDIEAAVQWSDQIADTNMRRQVVAHLGTTWGALEPDRAVQWLSTLPPQLAQSGLVGAFNSWGSVDPNGMREWVENTDASYLSDQARRSLADVLSRDNILASIDVAMGLSNNDQRNDAVARYFREWRKNDDASAQEWYQMAKEAMPPDLLDRVQREQQARIVARP